MKKRNTEDIYRTRKKQCLWISLGVVFSGVTQGAERSEVRIDKWWLERAVWKERGQEEVRTPLTWPGDPWVMTAEEEEESRMTDFRGISPALPNHWLLTLSLETVHDGDRAERLGVRALGSFLSGTDGLVVEIKTVVQSWRKFKDQIFYGRSNRWWRRSRGNIYLHNTFHTRKQLTWKKTLRRR